MSFVDISMRMNTLYSVNDCFSFDIMVIRATSLTIFYLT